MTANDWHVDQPLWAAYAEGRLDAVAEASVDAHVNRCARCREAGRAQIEAAQLESLWEGIRADVARPTLPWTLRWLRRLGVPEDELVVLAASDGLALPWALAVGGALVCALLTGLVPARQDETFLLLAPLVPVLAIIAAFDATDRLRTLAAAAPYSWLRLALVRVTATLLVALPVTLAVGLGIPGLEPLAFTWLLPALALTSSVLVLLTWLGTVSAAGTVAAAWATVVLTTAGLQEVTVFAGAAVQLGFVAVVLAMGSLLVVRTTTFSLPGGEL